MAKTKTSITPEKRAEMPPRGRSKKTLILESVKESAMLELTPSATNEDAEKAIFKHLSKSAFNLGDDDRGLCLKILMDKGWANVKPSSELVEFEFDIKAKPHIQASQIVNAASSGQIPPDIANSLVSSIASMLKIEEVTEMTRRLEEIEKQLGVVNG